ncbi:MAG: C25 family cysteine peptidase [Candidatus Zixiibacteriota bacterium]
MKKFAIIVVTVCLLLICTVWSGSAALREHVVFNSGLSLTTHNPDQTLSVEYADNQQVTKIDGLPNLVRRYVVKNGDFDSVSIARMGKNLIASDCSIYQEPIIATFAGDSYRDDQFYSRELSSIKSESAPSVLIDRGFQGNSEILTLLIQPFEYDAASRTLCNYTDIQLLFHGSADLEIAELLDSDLLESASPLQKNGSPGGSAEYLIVTGAQFFSAFDDLIRWKTQQGLTVEIAAIGDIVGQFPGVDAAERLRNYLIGKYNSGARYVLLGGDEQIIPTRYTYHANTSATPSLDLMNICDLYYGDVNGVWEVDGDGVYGEPTQDRPDLYAELLVGRLPFHQAGQFEAYIDKLIAYEQNPGNGSYDYLNRALFISADQMRDYQSVGQHSLLSASYPSYVTSEMSDLVEAPTGDAANPPTPLASGAIQTMSSGWGMMTLLIHGVADGWVLRSNQYNTWPKSLLFTGAGADGDHGFLPNIESNGKPGVIYSIGCDNAAFDMDSPPFSVPNPCVAESFLAKPNGGAVGFVGYSRWGWVASSWRLEQSFIDYLYNTGNNPAEAVRFSKSQYSYFRDLCYGLNYFGDPAMKVWTNTPLQAHVNADKISQIGAIEITATVTDGSSPLSGAIVSVMQNGEIIAQAISGVDGSVGITIEYNITDDFSVTAYKSGHTTATAPLVPEITLDADDETGNSLPQEFALYQNFPNPFNPATTIQFDVPAASEVVIEIYNVVGQLIKTSYNGFVGAGSHEVAWNGANEAGQPVSSGVYFARMISDNYVQTIKMSLLK